MTRQYKVVDVTGLDAQSVQNALSTEASDGWKLFQISENHGKHMAIFEK